MRLLSLLMLLLFWPASVSLAYSVTAKGIVDDSGKPVALRGINWFGFETQDAVIHGLWARNWEDMIQQMKGLGFNAVRLPFCPGSLRGKAPQHINYSLNADLQGLNSQQIFDKLVKAFDSEGFFILLDFHHHDCNWISELWYTDDYSEQNWIDDLTWVAQRYRDVPGVIGLDLKHEPHGAATWGTGNLATDWNLAAERAAAAVMPIAPRWLMFVEGIADSSTCTEGSGHFWGENLQPLNCKDLQIPASKRVLSPHVYGPDVYEQAYFKAADFPKNLPAIWELHFGHATEKGYHVVLGEFGGPYGEDNASSRADPRDIAWQNTLVDYLIAKGMTDSFYWSWNPNSPDTGGILRDDWKSVRSDKVQLLRRLWTSAPPSIPDREAAAQVDTD